MKLYRAFQQRFPQASTQEIQRRLGMDYYQEMSDAMVKLANGGAYIPRDGER